MDIICLLICVLPILKCMDNELDDCGYTYCSEALGHGLIMCLSASRCVKV